MSTQHIFLLSLESLAWILFFGAIIYFARKYKRVGNNSINPNDVEETLKISEILEMQAEMGFTEIILRNPKTGKEVAIDFPKPKS